MRLEIPRPNEKQRAFLQVRARFVAYGGARGGGKSWAVRVKAALLAVKYPGIRVLILRRTYPELRENHILPMIRLLKGVAAYRDTDKAFTFPGGSRVRFGYCAGDMDVNQYQGQEYDVIFIDEATQFTEYQFSVLTACVRGTGDCPKRVYLTCNPGGVGHAWVKRLFVDRDFRPGENPDDYVMVRATVYDNKALMERDPGYVGMLRNLPEDLRRAWLYGDWDVYEGQFFREFNRETHVCAPFAVPPGWRKYVTMDYGLDMLAVLWVALDPGGRAFVYRELAVSDRIISDAAADVKRLSEGEEIYAYLAPPDLWSRRQETGKSAAEWFSEAGLWLDKTSNSRVDGWYAVKEWLKPSPEGPKLRIFESCKNLIRCLPLLQHDMKNPSDVAAEPHEITHLPDALRGFCVHRSAPAKGGEARRADIYDAFSIPRDRGDYGKERIWAI